MKNFIKRVLLDRINYIIGDNFVINRGTFVLMGNGSTLFERREHKHEYCYKGDT
jgi:hypothetical protein